VTDERFAAAALPLLGLMARALGWRPDEFWAATPADVAAVLGGWRDWSVEAAVDRAGLTAMMEQFPDG
jgi:uncharacterized phage protein (TIGR02216 family)